MTPEQNEMLIRVEQKLTDFSVSNSADHAAIKVTQDVIDSRLNETKKEVYAALNNRPRWDVIMWLLAGVFVSLITISGFIYNIDRDIQQHIVAGEKIYLEDTGKSIDLHGD